jgi:hypothetical protein
MVKVFFVLQCASVSWEVVETGQCPGKVAEEWCYGLQRELKKVVWSPERTEEGLYGLRRELKEGCMVSVEN